MMIKKVFYLITSLVLLQGILYSDALAQNNISPILFGQNAWMPDSMGSIRLYGQLEKKWQQIKGSKAKVIRFGGISPDYNRPTGSQYLKIIDSARANGMEPILQVSFANYKYTAAQAAEIVRYVNVTKGRNVKYWIIANEPDLKYGVTSASQIAPYFKSFASAMKAVDPSIKIIGPECAWYNHGIIRDLTTPGGPNDITGKDANGRFYCDIVSFHTYPFSGTQTRTDVINKLNEPYNFRHNLEILSTQLASCNSYHGRSANPLKMAVTEANVNYKNPSVDGLNGLGANSFIGGQFWAEMLGISMEKGVEFMNFWSVVEGNTNELNIGYIDRTTGAYKPCYYHFQMMASNFRGVYAASTDNQNNVKVFASKASDQIAVMVLNQDYSDMPFTIRLDNTSITNASTLKANVSCGLAKEFSGTISNQSSMIVIFDAYGNAIRQIDYKLKGNADLGLAPTVKTIAPVVAATVTATITASSPLSFCQGSSVILSANSGTNYTYQWRKDGVEITGSTSRTLTVTASGSYQVKVTSGTANALSASSQVTVNPKPAATITASGSTSISSGSSVTLNANTGTGLKYQWYKNGVAISNAINASLVVNAAGSYTVKVINATGCDAISLATNVTISALTASVTPSGSTTFCAGASVVLKANTGTNYTYQWKKDGVSISGATGSSYTATSSGIYQVKVVSGTATAYSSNVTVTASPKPSSAITYSGSTSIPSGGSVTLNANTGVGLTYQWTKDNVNIANATSSTYKATVTGAYGVVVKNSSGCWASSNSVTVTVASSSGIVNSVTPAGPLSLCPGTSAKLSTAYVRGDKFQWFKNGLAISNATAYYYTVSSSGTYYVRITNESKVKNSNSVAVTVSTVKATITASGPTTVPGGGSVTLNGSTGSNYIYQWKKDGIAIVGATSSYYKATTSGSYQLKVSQNGCNDWSAPISVTIGSTAKLSSVSSPESSSGMVTSGKGLKKGTPGNVTGQVVSGKALGVVVNTGEEDAAAMADSAAADSTNGTLDVAKPVSPFFNVKIGPVPSNDVFNLIVNSSDVETTITVNVFDMNGRLCEFITDKAPNQTIKYGDQLSSGVYITEIKQGDNSETIKVIKLD